MSSVLVIGGRRFIGLIGFGGALNFATRGWQFMVAARRFRCVANLGACAAVTLIGDLSL